MCTAGQKYCCSWRFTPQGRSFQNFMKIYFLFTKLRSSEIPVLIPPNSIIQDVQPSIIRRQVRHEVSIQLKKSCGDFQHDFHGNNSSWKFSSVILGINLGDFKRHFRESCLLDISSMTLGVVVCGKVKADFREKNLSWISSSSKNNR